MRDRTENQVELVLIRHGKTAANLARRYQGREDAPLDEVGQRELCARKSEGFYPAEREPDFVFVSPMRRCVETAELLYPGRNICCIEEFLELDFGEFEGRNYEELKQDARYQAWLNSRGMTPPPGGESREVFVRRCGSGFLKMLGELSGKKESWMCAHGGEKISDAPASGIKQGNLMIVAVVHGGTIMALLSSYGGGSYYDYQCENGGMFRCIVRFAQEPGGRILPDSVVLEQTGRR